MPKQEPYGCVEQGEVKQILEQLNWGEVAEIYKRFHIIPTSQAADEVLIRLHILYHSGKKEALQATIRKSRGYSYVVNGLLIVKIVDPYSHRSGVTGWVL